MSEATYWKGMYNSLLYQHIALIEALGFLSPDNGDVIDVGWEAVARARQYRKWVTDCSLDNPEEWDD